MNDFNRLLQLIEENVSPLPVLAIVGVACLIAVALVLMYVTADKGP